MANINTYFLLTKALNHDKFKETSLSLIAAV